MLVALISSRFLSCSAFIFVVRLKSKKQGNEPLVQNISSLLESFYGGKFDPFLTINVLLEEFSSIQFNPPFKKNYQKFLFYVFYFPVDLLICAIFIYILIPLASLKSGIIVALGGEICDETTIMQGLKAKEMPVMKLFENLGEAVPQAIMCLLFIINNFEFIVHEETSTWMPIPISIVSLVFSVGSIMMGIYRGTYRCCGMLIGMWNDNE